MTPSGRLASRASATAVVAVLPEPKLKSVNISARDTFHTLNPKPLTLNPKPLNPEPSPEA